MMTSNHRVLSSIIGSVLLVSVLVIDECSAIGPSLSNTYSGRGRGRGRSWTYFGPVRSNNELIESTKRK